MKLDQYDKKILHSLMKNSRMPISLLSKKIKLSRTAIFQRIKKLESSGIISSYKCIIDYNDSGLMYSRLGINLNPLKEKTLNELIGFIESLENVTWIANAYGYADLLVAILCNNVDDILITLRKIQEKYYEYIKSYEFSIAHTITNCVPSVLFSNLKKIEPIEIKFGANKNKLSSTDLKILKKLNKNPRQNIIDLAKSIGCTTKTCIQHKKQLEKKYIKRYCLSLNMNKLGYDTYHVSWLFNNKSLSEIKKFKEFLLSLENICYVTEALYKYDIESEFIIKNQKELYNLINKINLKFPNLINSYEIMMVYDVLFNK